MAKLQFKGIIISIQPRIRLTRSFDESSHGYLGYALKLTGTIAGDEKDFSIGIGKAAHEKHQFKAGEVISGECVPVGDERLEPVEFYKPGPNRKVDGRSGMVYVEEDWVDEMQTEHREPHE